MATTPQQVIIDALTVLGVVFPGQTPGSSILNDAFSRLNQMLASWSIDRLTIFGTFRATYALAGGTNSYTIGSGGVFNATRPNAIISANILVSALPVRSMLKQVTVEEWAAIPDQTASSTTPSLIYNDEEYPLSTLYLWPTPNGSATTLELYTWQPLEQFVTLADSFDMPPGYQGAVTYALAEILAMVYGRQMSQEAMDTLSKYMTNLRAQNAPPTHIDGMGEEAIARSQVAQQLGNQPTNVNPPLKR